MDMQINGTKLIIYSIEKNVVNTKSVQILNLGSDQKASLQLLLSSIHLLALKRAV